MVKVAVCLSGQPRTVEYTLPSIVNFFNQNYKCDYFCHTWNYNDYKTLNPNTNSVYLRQEAVDTHKLNQLLIDGLNPKKLVIDTRNTIPATVKTLRWGSALYSGMIANHLKKQYEIEHNFRYDVVIKSRYDLIFPPGQGFISNHTETADQLTIYTRHANRMPSEYNRFNISDITFYGSSLAMDIASDLFRFAESLDTSKDDCHNLGPGTLMDIYIRTQNLNVETTPIPETIYRESAIPLSATESYTQIEEINNGIIYRG